jgi:hypothetical protein
MAAEFVIWGKAPGSAAESLLLDAPHGERITSRGQAERYLAQLRDVHGCTALRIQEIDLSKPFDFASMALGKGV